MRCNTCLYPPASYVGFTTVRGAGRAHAGRQRWPRERRRRPGRDGPWSRARGRAGAVARTAREWRPAMRSGTGSRARRELRYGSDKAPPLGPEDLLPTTDGRIAGRTLVTFQLFVNYRGGA